MLRDEIVSFIDANGLVAPALPTQMVTRSSDNGVLFSSQLYILYLLRDELEPGDREDYAKLINNCIDTELRREPQLKGTDEVDQIDDYVGVFAARGLLDVVDEIKLDLPLRLWRMPQVVFLSLAHRWKWYHPGHVLAMLYAAGTILISCKGVETGKTDERILSWLLVQGTKNHSLVCRLAARVWSDRLYADYGPEPMKKVASIYFSRDNHPFGRYWKTE